MKNIVLALLVVTVVLFVAVESHGGNGRYRRRGRGRWRTFRVNNQRPWPGRKPWRSWRGGNYGRPGPWHKPCNETEPPRNCSVFVNGTCLVCDEGFALETKNFSRKPDQRPHGKHNPWYHRLFNLFSSKKSSGYGANFQGCNKTISFCVPCSRYLKIIDTEKCRHGGCGSGCTNCRSPGVCIECKEDMKLYTPPNSNRVQCIPPICEPNVVKPTTNAVKPTIEEGESVVLEP